MAWEPYLRRKFPARASTNNTLESRIGGGHGGMDAKKLTTPIRQWMQQNGITFTIVDGSVDTLSNGDKTWKVHCMGGTWQHVYIQNGADLYARYFNDDNMRDFTIAFAQMSARHMLSPKCHQTWYYGSKRGYRTKDLSGGLTEVVRFAGHEPPKDDTVLEV